MKTIIMYNFYICTYQGRNRLGCHTHSLVYSGKWAMSVFGRLKHKHRRVGATLCSRWYSFNPSELPNNSPKKLSDAIRSGSTSLIKGKVVQVMFMKI